MASRIMGAQHHMRLIHFPIICCLQQHRCGCWQQQNVGTKPLPLHRIASKSGLMPMVLPLQMITMIAGKLPLPPLSPFVCSKEVLD